MADKRLKCPHCGYAAENAADLWEHAKLVFIGAIEREAKGAWAK